MSDYLEFLREKLGKNWVLARRSARIVAKYGEDVNCVGRKRYAEVECEYRELYGDPYDSARAAMWKALLKAAVIIAAWEVAPGVLAEINAAIAAERAAFHARYKPNRPRA